MIVRPMKVADMFYPADREVLIQMFEVFWSKLDSFQVKNLKAGVVPHAGYVYSGQIATYTYEAIKQNLDNIPKTIFILTPDHYI
jgi:AmmeMemoRadiSam system protein B